MKTARILYIIVMLMTIFGLARGQNQCDLEVLSPTPNITKGEDVELPTVTPRDGGFQARSGEDYRMLFLLHGLNGTSESWTRVNGAVVNGGPGLPKYKVLTQLPDYNKHQNSFKTASAFLTGSDGLRISDNLPSTYDPKNSILIGHSQGGLVGRYVDKYYSEPSNQWQRKFGGLVTVTTSNQGAQVLNNIIEFDMMNVLVKDMSEDMSAGLYSELANSRNFFFRVLSRIVNADELRDYFIGLLGGKLTDAIIAKNIPTITNEYMVGAEMITNVLNEYDPIIIHDGEESSTNIVAVYSIKDTLYNQASYTLSNFTTLIKGQSVIRIDSVVNNFPVPISWATLNFLQTSPNETGELNSHLFEPELAARMHLTRLDYEAAAARNNSMANTIRKFPFPIAAHYPWLFITNRIDYNNAISRRDNWMKGVNFLNSFDRRYRVLIGALFSEIVQEEEIVYTFICECTGEGLAPLSMFSGPFGDCSNITELFPGYECEVVSVPEVVEGEKVVWRHKDSDGLVLVESQMDIPQATAFPIEVLNSTHMGIRNDVNTASFLSYIFEGNAGEFFQTQQKD